MAPQNRKRTEPTEKSDAPEQATTTATVEESDALSEAKTTEVLDLARSGIPYGEVAKRTGVPLEQVVDLVNAHR